MTRTKDDIPTGTAEQPSAVAPTSPGYSFVETLTEAQTLALHGFYQREWWTNARTLEQTKAIVANSSMLTAIVDTEGNLLAFTRVVTDFTIKALVLDVIVAEEQRGRGLGVAMMRHVLEHQRLTDVSDFELYCRPDMEPFYQQWGFTSGIQQLQFMRLRRSVAQ